MLLYNLYNIIIIFRHGQLVKLKEELDSDILKARKTLKKMHEQTQKLKKQLRLEDEEDRVVSNITVYVTSYLFFT